MSAHNIITQIYSTKMRILVWTLWTLQGNVFLISASFQITELLCISCVSHTRSNREDSIPLINIYFRICQYIIHQMCSSAIRSPHGLIARWQGILAEYKYKQKHRRTLIVRTRTPSLSFTSQHQRSPPLSWVKRKDDIGRKRNPRTYTYASSTIDPHTPQTTIGEES